MCLFPDQTSKVLKASEDMLVFKILKTSPDNACLVTAPYIDRYVYVLGELDTMAYISLDIFEQNCGDRRIHTIHLDSSYLNKSITEIFKENILQICTDGKPDTYKTEMYMEGHYLWLELSSIDGRGICRKFRCEINEGFHSYHPHQLQTSFVIGNSYHRFACIIPKGSVYVENDFDDIYKEITSNQIIPMFEVKHTKRHYIERFIVWNTKRKLKKLKKKLQ